MLIHEVTFREEQQDKADEHLHSTAAGAVASAQSVGATYLALTHYSNRIKDAALPEQEASDSAKGMPVVALNDNDRLIVDDDGRLMHLAWGADGWNTTNITPNR